MPLEIKLTLWGGQPITLMSSSWMPGETAMKWDVYLAKYFSTSQRALR